MSNETKYYCKRCRAWVTETGLLKTCECTESPSPWIPVEPGWIELDAWDEENDRPETIRLYGYKEPILEQDGPMPLGELSELFKPQPGKLARLFNSLVDWLGKEKTTKGKTFGETFKD